MVLRTPRSNKATLSQGEVKARPGSLTPLCNHQHRLGNVVINIWRVLHAADEGPVVTEHWVLDNDGSIALSNVPNPGYPVFELPRWCGVWDGLVMKNLQGGKGNNFDNKTLIQKSRVNGFSAL